jgi:hypothetical protein
VASKADFNAEEWAAVVEAPVLAGLHVVSAQHGGTIRESVAIGKVYSEARKAQDRSELLDELLASPPGVDPKRLQGERDLAGATRDRLREALRILGEKGAPEDVDAYRTFVMDVARAAAEAHKEGGFIGIGGKQVSPKEAEALEEIGAALGA